MAARVGSRWGKAQKAGRNVEVMWLTARLVPDHKTIADFRKDNGRAIRQVCSRFVVLCRTMGLCCTDRPLGGEDWTVYQGPRS